MSIFHDYQAELTSPGAALLRWKESITSRFTSILPKSDMPPSNDTSAPTGSRDTSPERIRDLAHALTRSFGSALNEIDNINLQTRLLSFNAQIEAARAGAFGTSFGVVASEMQTLSKSTEAIARRLEGEAKSTAVELEDISSVMANNVRGTRLSDMAAVNIDLIDRNLYERTCDVRWWATDSAVVEALVDPTPARLAHASKRLGIILDAYTVYYDIVLCSLDGTILANGRPELHRVTGTNTAACAWHQSAVQANSGNEFGFESVTANPLVGGKLTATFSCGVRTDGESDGQLLGVLGVIFNWEGFAQVIMERTPIQPELDKITRRCVIDAEGRVLADSFGKMLREPLNLSSLEKQFAGTKSFAKTRLENQDCFVGHARSVGYETYASGWRSVIIEPIAAGERA